MWPSPYNQKSKYDSRKSYSTTTSSSESSNSFYDRYQKRPNGNKISQWMRNHRWWPYTQGQGVGYPSVPYMPNYAPKYASNQEPNQGPIYGPNLGPYQGPYQEPNQGPSYGPYQGPYQEPNQGPSYGPSQGPIYGPPPYTSDIGYDPYVNHMEHYYGDAGDTYDRRHLKRARNRHRKRRRVDRGCSSIFGNSDIARVVAVALLMFIVMAAVGGMVYGIYYAASKRVSPIVADGDITFPELTWNQAYSDRNSPEFSDFKDKFCSAIEETVDENSLVTNVLSCVITALRQGSVIVEYEINLSNGGDIDEDKIVLDTLDILHQEINKPNSGNFDIISGRVSIDCFKRKDSSDCVRTTTTLATTSKSSQTTTTTRTTTVPSTTASLPSTISSSPSTSSTPAPTPEATPTPTPNPTAGSTSSSKPIPTALPTTLSPTTTAPSTTLSHTTTVPPSTPSPTTTVPPSTPSPTTTAPPTTPSPTPAPPITTPSPTTTVPPAPSTTLSPTSAAPPTTLSRTSAAPSTTLSSTTAAPTTTLSPTTTVPPTTPSPTTTAPLTTLSPTSTAPPTTLSPTSVAPPTTLSPTSAAPLTTLSPTTPAPPTALSPTSTAPSITLSPTTTAPPTTLSPTTTAPPTTLSPTTTAPPTTLSPTSTAPSTTLSPTSVTPPTTLSRTSAAPSTTLSSTTAAPSTTLSLTPGPPITTPSPPPGPPSTTPSPTAPLTTLTSYVPSTISPTTAIQTSTGDSTAIIVTSSIGQTTMEPTSVPLTTLKPTSVDPSSMGPTSVPLTTLKPTTIAQPTVETSSQSSIVQESTSTAPTSLMSSTTAPSTVEPTSAANPTSLGITIATTAPPNITCDDISCENNGTCQENGTTAYCVCPPEFTGALCETEFDPCDPNPCQNGGTCVSAGGTFHCECGYLCPCANAVSGPLCQRNLRNPSACEDEGIEDLPDPDDCHKYTTCENGAYKSNRLCSATLIFHPMFRNCTEDVPCATIIETTTQYTGTPDPSPCDPNPCKNNGSCTEISESPRYKCDCGYSCPCANEASNDCAIDLYSCAGSPVIGSSFYPHPDDCNYHVACNNGGPWVNQEKVDCNGKYASLNPTERCVESAPSCHPEYRDPSTSPSSSLPSALSSPAPMISSESSPVHMSDPVSSMISYNPLSSSRPDSISELTQSTVASTKATILSTEEPNSCTPNPCMNGGTCILTNDTQTGGYKCDCGYTCPCANEASNDCAINLYSCAGSPVIGSSFYPHPDDCNYHVACNNGGPWVNQEKVDCNGKYASLNPTERCVDSAPSCHPEYRDPSTSPSSSLPSALSSPAPMISSESSPVHMSDPVSSMISHNPLSSSRPDSISELTQSTVASTKATILSTEEPNPCTPNPCMNGGTCILTNDTEIGGYKCDCGYICPCASEASNDCTIDLNTCAGSPAGVLYYPNPDDCKFYRACFNEEILHSSISCGSAYASLDPTETCTTDRPSCIPVE